MMQLFQGLYTSLTRKRHEEKVEPFSIGIHIRHPNPSDSGRDNKGEEECFKNVSC
jgi:hypothetical protein